MPSECDGGHSERTCGIRVWIDGVGFQEGEQHMTQPLKSPTTDPAIRVVMMPRDTNADGSIFGGVILSLIDQAAWIEALRQCHRRYVTVAMESVEFHKPVLQGDVLSLWGSTLSIGTSSVRVKVDVRALRTGTGEQIAVTTAEVVLVAVDEHGNPTPLTNASESRAGPR